MTTFIVDVFADEVDGDTSAGHLSLREAIALANADPDPDPIIKFSLAGQTIVLSLGELALTEDVTIDGDVNGDHQADITISGNDASRVFNISGATTDVTLQSLTLTDGYAAAGGGLADGQGGAVLAYDIGSLFITDTTIKDSNADTYGGGLRVYAAEVSIANSTIHHNTSGAEGGGAFITSSIAVMDNTTLYFNDADGNGGGISFWGPGTLELLNSDVVNNLAGLGASGGGLYVLGDPDGDVFIKNTLISGNVELIEVVPFEQYDPDDVAGTIDLAVNSAFGTTVTIGLGQGNILSASFGALGISQSLGDNGGTVQTLARSATSVLIDAGDNSVLHLDPNDVDHDANTLETLPLDANGQARVDGSAVDIGAVEYSGGDLFDALDSLPLLDSAGNPVTGNSLFNGSNETVVFVLPSTTYFDGSIDMFAAGQVIQANALLAAAEAAGHNLDVRMICLDGFSGPLPGLSAAAKVLHLANPSSPTSKAAVDVLYGAFDPGFAFDAKMTLSRYALHRAPGEDSVGAVDSIVPTATLLGYGGQVEHQIVDTDLEAALAPTGNDVDLSYADSTFPNLTTPIGAYDQVGEVVPDLTFLDQNGNPFSLHSFGEGLVVLSICPLWCAPCDAYSSNLNTISAEASPVYNFVEIIVENVSSGLAFTKDAKNWSDNHDLTVPVVTTDGNVPLLENFYRGSQTNEFPDYFIIDGATGKIVDHFVGFIATLPEHLDDVAEAYYKPVFSSGAAATVAENIVKTTVVHDANAADADDKAGQPKITYSLAGADASKFTINSATGQVRFAASPDFETPKDAGANNIYDITVRANDGVNVTTRAVKISVTDKFEGTTTTGNDTISGTAANEILNGGLGNDILRGKAGKDFFVFNSKLDKNLNLDHIIDFAPGVDEFQLDRSFFKKLPVGDLNPKAFIAGKAKKKDDHILYDKLTGVLSFDIDGRGGTKAIKFAVLDGSPDSLSAKDFMIVA